MLAACRGCLLDLSLISHLTRNSTSFNDTEELTRNDISLLHWFHILHKLTADWNLFSLLHSTFNSIKRSFMDFLCWTAEKSSFDLKRRVSESFFLHLTNCFTTERDLGNVTWTVEFACAFYFFNDCLAADDGIYADWMRNYVRSWYDSFFVI